MREDTNKYPARRLQTNLDLDAHIYWHKMNKGAWVDSTLKSPACRVLYSEQGPPVNPRPRCHRLSLERRVRASAWDFCDVTVATRKT